jgi:cytochrome c oxidase accessory protein FixG
MKPLTYHARRRFFFLLQAALMLGLPFVRISGESALRFDMTSLKLYFFGSVIWISEAYYFFLVFLLFFLGIMLFTVIYGRIWCGWTCPQTIFSDVARSVEKIAAWFVHHRVLRMLVSQFVLVMVSMLVSANLIWFFVSPYDVFRDMVARSLGPWTFRSWVAFSLLIYLNLAFVRQKFCTSVCPYARLESAVSDDRTLSIAFDPARRDECLGCEACTSKCPTDVDIRRGLQADCIDCAECIDTCAGQMSTRGKKPLIGYVRGTTRDEAKKSLRHRVIGLSVAFGLIAVLFAYQVYVRMPMDFRVMRDEEQPYHQIGVRGQMMNAYFLLVENRSLQPALCRLSVSGVKDAELVFDENPFLLPGNSLIKLKVYVFVQRENLVERETQLHFVLQNIESNEIRVVQEAPFVYPERSDKGVEI